MNSLARRIDSSEPRRVFVIGLDCAAPELVFDLWRDHLPNLIRLANNGIWGELQSCIPAITVPAWSCMFSGKDPGELGIYGFRNRANSSYYDRVIASSRFMREKRVWDYLTEIEKRSVVIGVPQTFPVKPLNGRLISSILTPSREDEFTYPATLRGEVLAIAPDYDVDVPQFRTDDKDWLLRQIREMTEKRFRVVDHLLVEESWDLFVLVEIGVDRIHHGFWSYHDPKHRRYQAGNPYEDAIREYYTYVDESIGRWLDMVDEDTVILVVSDHGAKRMEGGICLNEWLWREGYLAFEKDPEPGKIVAFDELKVDWTRTKAWGDGGYYGRVFLNVIGREPEGVIPQSAYEEFRDELAGRLGSIPDPTGNAIDTQVFKPQEIYRRVRGIAPDLMVYFGDLLWRSVGSLGHGAVHTLENDTGPDDCNHAQNGLFILYDPRNLQDGRKLIGAQLMDIMPTLMGLFDLKVPGEIQGEDIFEKARG